MMDGVSSLFYIVYDILCAKCKSFLVGGCFSRS